MSDNARFRAPAQRYDQHQKLMIDRVPTPRFSKPPEALGGRGR